MAAFQHGGENIQGLQLPIRSLEQTKVHVQRLEEIFESLDESPKGKKCVGMQGLAKESSEVMEEGFEDAVLDAGLIGAARRVEHYEMAAYGAACEIAKVLGQTKQASLLEKTLTEEKQTDEKLAKLATDINTKAKEESSEEQTHPPRERRRKSTPLSQRKYGDRFPTKQNESMKRSAHGRQSSQWGFRRSFDGCH